MKVRITVVWEWRWLSDDEWSELKRVEEALRKESLDDYVMMKYEKIYE